MVVNCSVTMREETESSRFTCATSRSSGRTSRRAVLPLGKREAAALDAVAAEERDQRVLLRCRKSDHMTVHPDKLSLARELDAVGGRRASNSSSLPAERSENIAGTLTD